MKSYFYLKERREIFWKGFVVGFISVMVILGIVKWLSFAERRTDILSDNYAGCRLADVNDPDSGIVCPE